MNHPIIKFFTSLKLTVVLLGLGMALVFFGTLDQVHTGIWETQRRYFESLFVIWSYPEQWWAYDKLGFIRLPMPGGYLLGGFLLVNLVVSHIYRFKWTWKKSGIFLVHVGLILLLLSEFLTDVLAEESQMAIQEGGRTYFSENFRDNELVFIDRSHPEYDSVTRIPASKLARSSDISHPDLPFSIRTVSFFPNSFIGRKGQNPSFPTPPVTRGIGAPRGAAEDLVVGPRAVTYSENEVNTATAMVEIVDESGTSMGTWLVSNLFDNRFPTQTFQAGGTTYEIALRFRRYYHDFGLALKDFRFDRYPGTEIPKNFSSDVTILDPALPNAERSYLIYMNHPLRYGGLTFYQASYDPETEQTTILQVVRNPGWLLPYFSVLLMGAGMTVQFGMHLFRFSSRRKREAVPQPA